MYCLRFNHLRTGRMGWYVSLDCSCSFLVDHTNIDRESKSYFSIKSWIGYCGTWQFLVWSKTHCPTLVLISCKKMWEFDVAWSPWHLSSFFTVCNIVAHIEYSLGAKAVVFNWPWDKLWAFQEGGRMKSIYNIMKQVVGSCVLFLYSLWSCESHCVIPRPVVLGMGPGYDTIRLKDWDKDMLSSWN
jgi:hypothetical protein